MSHFKEIEHRRLRFNFMDSPTFANDSGPGYSPMTNLALNLSDANLSATPRRKLSLCSNDGTPPTMYRNRSLKFELAEGGGGGGGAETPRADRLLKSATKAPASPAGAGRGAGAGPGRGAGRPSLDKENQRQLQMRTTPPASPAAPSVPAPPAPAPAPA